MWIYDFPLRLQVVYQNLLLQFFSNMECDCAADNFKSTPILHIFRRLHPTWTRGAAVFSFPAVYNGKEMTMMSSKGKIFDGSCVSKMMILLIILLCCYVFQVFVPVLVSSRGGGFIFFLPFIYLAVFVSDITTLCLYPSVSLVHVHSGCYLIRESYS